MSTISIAMSTLPVIFAQISNFLAITPWYNFKNATLIRPTVYKIYSSGTFLFLLFIATYLVYNNLSLRMTLLMRLGIYLETSSEVLIAAVLVFASITKSKHWTRLLAKKRCVNLYVTYFDKRTSSLRFSKYMIFDLLILADILFELYEWCRTGSPKMTLNLLIPPRLVYNHGYMVAAMIATNIGNALKTTNSSLKTVLTTRHQVASFEKTASDIREIRILYREIWKKVDSYNAIFGHFFLSAVSCLVISCLSLLNFVFIRMSPRARTALINRVGFSLLSVMSGLFYTILCCDKTSRQGKKFLRTCYTFRGERLLGRSYEELSQLVEYIKDHPVAFTATNYFDINRGTLLSVVNIIATYLIVSTQFYGLHF